MTADAVLPRYLGYSFDPLAPGARAKVAKFAQRIADTMAADAKPEASVLLAGVGGRAGELIDDLADELPKLELVTQPLPTEKAAECRADWNRFLANGSSGLTASYWPEGTFAGLEPWYSVQLCSLGEPPLAPLGDDDATILRLLWLPSFHPAVTIRIEHREGRASVWAAEYQHAHEEGPAERYRLISPKSLSENDWSSLERELAAIDFAQLPEVDPNRSYCCDGSEWLIELVRGEHYHAVARRNGAELEPLGRRMIELSGLAPERIY
ncbi:MAG: hypothetical protein KC560_13185 [Myxococcales bacterium]|nr:hypothetical protein [Myxococcales bacterium]